MLAHHTIPLAEFALTIRRTGADVNQKGKANFLVLFGFRNKTHAGGGGFSGLSRPSAKRIATAVTRPTMVASPG